MDNILEIKNLCKKYKNFNLQDINITLKRGFIMGVIGENGAGKTTIIKSIMNLVNRDNGEIIVFGKDNLKFEKEVKDRIGFVYDYFYGYDYLTLEDNINLIAPMYSKWDKEKENYYIKKYGLNKKQKLRELSKGMRMKFALCIALCHNAELILMDEPTAGLDPVVRSEVLDELQDLIDKENVGIIISTHITEDLERIADYITFIRKGRVEFSMSKEDVFDRFKKIKGNKEALTEEFKKKVISFNKNNFGFEALTDNYEDIRKSYSNIECEIPSLEDIMLFYHKK